ncbi:MAG TPA: hypothetical protein VGZ91_00210 [Candidatus Sulfotelmatobacter sp.]|jgi:hypothetical protein|nr:hypothetical protein [Candidatus Sulfotelmatobacter sp.]
MYTGTMYTGTLINDLMAAVERAEQAVQQRLMFSDRNNVAQRDQIFDVQTFQHIEESLAGAA